MEHGVGVRALAASGDEGRDVFAIGELLNGTYAIESVLGAGGMGQVFGAVDRLLDRRVAIKAAWRGMPAGMLRAEARAMAAVRHPCVVTVHALGTHRDIEYVVMERLYGVGLDAMLDERARAAESMRIDEVLELSIAMADALAAVHRAGISHRDIKPENVMIAVGGRVVLLDLGIVKPETTASRPGRFEGSPGYVAPEVVSMEVTAGSGHLADLYSLGVMIFEMLTGRLPFESDDVLELLARHVSEPAPDVREVRSDVPASLATVVASLLEKDPSARPITAEAVRWQLESIRRGESAPAAAPSVIGYGVLVVDRDAQFADSLARRIRDEAPFADVRIVADGESALAAIRARAPQLMFLDLDAPRMNGLEVCMYLRGAGLSHRTRIVGVGAPTSEGDRELFEQLGVRSFLPRDVGEFDRVAEIACENARAMRAQCETVRQATYA